MKKLIFLLACSLTASGWTHSLETRVALDAEYPNFLLTPGDVLPVTEKEVCVPGYSKTVRHVSLSEKKKVFEHYGVKWADRSQYEVDHFISLELGGSNELINLWPEPYLPKPGARQKDVVEDYLHKEVCRGAMTLKQAQEAVKNDWYKVYVEISGGLHQ